MAGLGTLSGEPSDRRIERHRRQSVRKTRATVPSPDRPVASSVPSARNFVRTPPRSGRHNRHPPPRSPCRPTDTILRRSAPRSRDPAFNFASVGPKGPREASRRRRPVAPMTCRVGRRVPVWAEGPRTHPSGATRSSSSYDVSGGDLCGNQNFTAGSCTNLRVAVLARSTVRNRHATRAARPMRGGRVMIEHPAHWLISTQV